MKRYVIILGIAAVLIAITPLLQQIKTVSAGNESEIVKCITQYGWETDGVLIDSTVFKIPNPFSNVYEKYNEIQIKQGFDLSRFRGKTVKRYTYKILNHVNSGKGDVLCNILVYNDKMIAADIMTTAIDGFMHGINETKYIK